MSAAREIGITVRVVAFLAFLAYMARGCCHFVMAGGLQK